MPTAEHDEFCYNAFGVDVAATRQSCAEGDADTGQSVAPADDPPPDQGPPADDSASAAPADASQSEPEPPQPDATQAVANDPPADDGQTAFAAPPTDDGQSIGPDPPSDDAQTADVAPPDDQGQSIDDTVPVSDPPPADSAAPPEDTAPPPEDSAPPPDDAQTENADSEAHAPVEVSGDGGAEGAGPGGNPSDAPTDPSTADPAQADPQPADTAPPPDGRSKDEVLQIMAQASDPQDLAIKLGLGPVRPDVLAQYLAQHGIDLSTPSQPPAKPAPDQGNRFYQMGFEVGKKGGMGMCPKDATAEDEQQYDQGIADGKKAAVDATREPMPTAGPTPPGQEIISREISVLDSDSDPPRVRFAIVRGTKAQVDQIEEQAKADIANGFVSGLAQGLAGIQEGRDKFNQAGQGALTTSTGEQMLPNGGSIRIER